MTVVASRPADFGADMRAALLTLSTRIAEAQHEDAVCRSVVEGLQPAAFGFDGVALFLAGTTSFEPALRASAGRFGALGDDPAELRLALRIEQSAIGELVVQRAHGRSFDKGDLDILAAAANQASIAIGRARLLEAERQRAGEQRALLDTLADLSGELELDKLLRAVLERAVSLLGVTGGELAVFDEPSEQLVVVASLSLGQDSLGTRMSLGEGGMGRVALSREPLIIPDYQAWEGRSRQYMQTVVRAVMVAPLLIGARLVGAISAVHSEPGRKFGGEDLRLLNLFAAQAAIAIGMDGWAVLAALKADPALADVPVVMATIVDEKQLGFALGAVEYLTKPIDRDRLRAVLARYLHRDNPSVLVVEDDAATRSVLARTLAAAGWDVIEAENGRAALERLPARPGLVLLDLMMPEMDGFEFLDALRGRPDGRGLPVIVITAKELTDEDRRRLNGGVERIVAKGAHSRDQLLAEVRELVAAHARAR